MTERFERAFEHILQLEGGYVYDPVDAGGETKFGISKRAYPELDIKNLTVKDAKGIYYCDYWKHGFFEEILSEKVSIKLFDFSVNMGLFQANLCVQRALRAVGRVVIEDGIIGTQTLTAINEVNAVALLSALKSEAAGFYRALVSEKPINNRFLEGWLNRAYLDI